MSGFIAKDEQCWPMGLGMTSEEKETMWHLVRFWNAFVQLDNTPHDSSDVCDAVHRIQGIFAIRVARRVNPEIWV